MKDALDLIKELLSSFFGSQNDRAVLDCVAENVTLCGLSGGETMHGAARLREYLADPCNSALRGNALPYTYDEECRLSDTNAYLKFSLTYNGLCSRICVSGTAVTEGEERKLSFLHFAWANPAQTESLLRELARQKAEKEAEDKFDREILKRMKGKLCTYALDEENHRLSFVQAMGEAVCTAQPTNAQPCGLRAQDGLLAVHPDDRARVWNSLAQAVRQDGAVYFSFRSIGGSWLNATCTAFGKRDGLPLLRVLLMPASILYDLQLQALEMDNVGIYIVDVDTDELYYANNTSFRFWGIEPCSCLGKTCHQMFAGRAQRCDWCFLNKADAAMGMGTTLEMPGGRVLAVSVNQKEWNGRRVLIASARDITKEHTLHKKMQEAQHEMQDLFENLPGGVVMHLWNGREMRPLYISKGFFDLHGEDGRAMLEQAGSLDFAVVHPDDLPGLKAFIKARIGEPDRIHIYRYRAWNRQRKEYIWIQITGKIKRQPDGQLLIYANYTDVDAEVKAAEAVRREEQLLETTCRLAHIWMFYYNPEKKQARLSKGLREDYHLPASFENFPEDFLAYPVISPESRAVYRQMLQKVAAGEDATTEMPVWQPDGTKREVRFEWHVTRQEAGKTVEIAALVVDITKEMAERRRIEKERQKLLGEDKALVAYSVTDLHRQTIVEVRDDALGSGICCGDTCAEFCAKVAPFLLTEADRQRFLTMRDPAYLRRQQEAGITEWTEDMRWKQANGQIRWRRSVYSIVENAYTGKQCLYCYLYDVTGEKVVQALFAGIQENLYLKTAVISFTSGQLYDFAGDDQDRRLVSTDYETARREYAAAEVLPEDAGRVLQQNELENIQKQLSGGQKTFSIEHRVMQNGTLRYRQLRFATVPGKEDICITVVRDITDLVRDSEQKNAELQRALTAANAGAQAKSEFLSRMSHEIRTPMNAIMGMTAIAQDNKSDFLQVSDCLAKIDSSSKYLLTLINDILEMSRIESGKTKLSEDRFDFAEMLDGIRTVAEPLAKKSDIRLEIANLTGNGSYYGDAVRIQQVMINLIGNALKFTKKYGRVRFAVSAAEDSETKTTFEFLVEDTGIGMSEAFMQKMFEPFSQEDSTTTSRYGGSGLGLAISRSLVEAMGGTITAESMVGIGTNFTVQILLEKAQGGARAKVEQTEEMPQEEPDAILKGKQILMAEDHPLNVMVAKKLLERKGVLITVAENGKIAVDTFRASAPGEYDLILMDIRMPVMDGLEAARQIRALDRPDAREIPIIAMTANALAEDRENAKAAGMDEHLAKPIEARKMYQMLAQQLARRKV